MPDGDEVDVRQIRRLAFAGIPDAAGDLRAVYWKLMWKVLPARREDWASALAEKYVRKGGGAGDRGGVGSSSGYVRRGGGLGCDGVWNWRTQRMRGFPHSRDGERVSLGCTVGRQNW